MVSLHGEARQQLDSIIGRPVHMFHQLMCITGVGVGGVEGRGEVRGVEGWRKVPQEWQLGGEVCTTPNTRDFPLQAAVVGQVTSTGPGCGGRTGHLHQARLWW